MAHPEVTLDYTSGSSADTTSFTAANPARQIQAYGAGSVVVVDASGTSRTYTMNGGDSRRGEWTAFTSTTCSRIVMTTDVNPLTPPAYSASPVNLAGGNGSVTGILPAGNAQDFADAGTIYTAAFTPATSVMHPFNFQATGNINFPKISAAINGLSVGLLNLGTGATAVTLVPSGTDSMGVVASGVTAATAASPASLKSQRYTANNTLGQWVPGI